MESDDKSSDSAEWIRVGRRRKVNKDSKRDIHPMGSRQDHPDQAAAFPAGPACFIDPPRSSAAQASMLLQAETEEGSGVEDMSLNYSPHSAEMDFVGLNGKGEVSKAKETGGSRDLGSGA
ncbi:hypothetical protein U1Q18_032725 [Sarracenia purpurea var. burkii]